MINRRPDSCWGRIVRIALCYVVALQAFLSAFDTTLAAASAPTSDALLVTCHGADGSPPSNGGDTEHPDKQPCVVCALAAAAFGLIPDPICMAELRWLPAASAGFAPSVVAVGRARVRAGYSRAPPSFA